MLEEPSSIVQEQWVGLGSTNILWHQQLCSANAWSLAAEQKLLGGGVKQRENSSLNACDVISRNNYFQSQDIGAGASSSHLCLASRADSSWCLRGEEEKAREG